MCSLPSRISSSCFPTMFLRGHCVSSSLKTGERNISVEAWGGERWKGDVLCDFAFLDDPLELVYQQRADPHCAREGG